MPIAPSKIPDVRDDLARYVSGDLVGQVVGMHIIRGGTYDLPSPEVHQLWNHAVAAYQARLRSMVATAELFHVSAEMTAVGRRKPA